MSNSYDYLHTEAPPAPAMEPYTEVEPARRPRAWEIREQREQAQALISDGIAMQMMEHLGGILDLLKAPPSNDVLATISSTIGTPGWSTWTWTQNYAAIAIANTSSHEMVIAGGSGSTDGKNPGRGAGVIFVPSGYFRVVSLSGTALTVYGTPGDTFDFTAYVRPQTPSAGQCGIG
jgi:hypothetical protein